VERRIRKRYVAGFLFCGNSVLLVRKETPEWQKGLLNGIGGKVEHGEASSEAMVREFREETGLIITRDQWHQFCRETGVDYITDFFTFRVTNGATPRPAASPVNDAGESQGWLTLSELPAMRQVGNLRWLVPMALDWRGVDSAVNATRKNIVDNPTW
jgi:8-oxo-dGTP diphosphatase